MSEQGRESVDSTESLPVNLAPDTRLRPGDKLGNRFLIIQFLARGGMGEVYEAIDQHLQGKPIAIKTLRPEIAADPQMRARFEREVLLAREVNHPNVCPTYDLLRVNGPPDPVLCLSMKLLRGESLAARLSRLGPMPMTAAVAIARQMAAGLDAAHAAGVIHRDFKPGNVILEFSGEDPHVYITDFGLSRLYDSDHTIGQVGRVAGTRGYLAPELFEGRMASPASDVYAFGVVLYELFTGLQPIGHPGYRNFKNATELRPELPPIWDRIIGGSLAQNPSQRFQSAGEALALLAGPSSGSRQVSARSRRPWLWVAAGSAALTGALFFAGPSINQVLHPLPERRFVAVMVSPSDRNSADIAVLNNVADAINAHLVRAESYVKDLLIIGPGDLSQQRFDKPAEAASAVGANLALAVSVSGSPQALNLELLDPASRKVLRHGSVPMNRAELSRVPEQAATAAVKLLDLPPRPQKWTDEDQIARLAVPTYELFAAAEELRRQPNDAGLDQAIEKYQRVLDAEPNFAIGYAKIALAYVRKYQVTRDSAALAIAERNAQRAIDRSPDSPNAVLSQALLYLYSGRASDALDSLAKVLKLDPGSAETLFYQAAAYRSLNRPDDEERTYRKIIEERPNYYRAHNELGRLLYRQSRYAESAKAFQEAAQIAPRQVLPLTNLGAAYLALGRKDDAIAAFRASLDRGPSELAYLNLGSIWFGEGSYQKALESYQQASQVKPGNDLVWRNIGDCYSVLGDNVRMLDNYTKAAGVLSEQLKVNPMNGAGWMTLAFYEAKLGHQTAAKTALNAAESNGATDIESQFTKAQALALLGRKSEAIDLLASCVRRGLALEAVRLALDLKEIRSDPRYIRQISAPVAKVEREANK